MRILIVEDDFVSRKLLSKLLEKYGKCDTAFDGLEALDTLSLSYKNNTPYDLVCLDIMMPKIDGVKVLKAVRDFEKKKGIIPQKRCKIIMVSALAPAQLVENAFEEGCNAYVEKPLDVEKFLDVLKTLGLTENS